MSSVKPLEFSDDGYFPDYDPDKARHVYSVRGWCNYSSDSTPEDPFGCWVGQRCPGACCVGDYNDKEHTSRQNIVVGVHGACRGDGTDFAQYMGIGVYFGEENPFNDGYYVEYIEKQPIQPATQRAEVSAAIAALQKICDIHTTMCKRKIDRKNNAGVKGLAQPLLRAFIKTDSDYLVKSMNDWLEKRRQTHYLTSTGKPITNKDVLETLDKWVCILERANCQVVFWHVPIERNMAAEELANDALDRAA